MADNKSTRGQQDRTRINVNEDYELRYWTQTLGVTEQELREAVREKGTSVDAVREYLKKS